MESELLQNLIRNLSISESDKSILLAEADAAGTTKEILIKIENILRAEEKAIRESERQASMEYSAAFRNLLRDYLADTESLQAKAEKIRKDSIDEISELKLRAVRKALAEMGR